MKRIIFLALSVLVLGFGSQAKADTFEEGTSTTTENGGDNGTPAGLTWNSQRISTGNIVLDQIDVMSSGSSDSFIYVYDTAISSQFALKKYEGWQGSSARTIDVDIKLSSGLYVSNLGTTPAVVRFKYKILSRY